MIGARIVRFLSLYRRHHDFDAPRTIYIPIGTDYLVRQRMLVKAKNYRSVYYFRERPKTAVDKGGCRVPGFRARGWAGISGEGLAAAAGVDIHARAKGCESCRFSRTTRSDAATRTLVGHVHCVRKAGKRTDRQADFAGELMEDRVLDGGRDRDRTCDPFGVNEVLSR